MDELKKFLDSVIQQLDLPKDLASEALRVFQMVWGKRGFYGTSKKVVLLSCLVYVAKQNCLPLKTKQFVEFLSPERSFYDMILGKQEMDYKTERKFKSWAYRTLNKYYKRIKWVLNQGPQACNITPTVFVEAYLKKLNAPKAVRRKAAELNRQVLEKKVCSGRSPSALAAAIVYLAYNLAGNHITQREVAELALVNEVTVRTNIQAIIPSILGTSMAEFWEKYFMRKRG